MGDGKFVRLAGGVLGLVAGLYGTSKASSIDFASTSLYSTKTDQHVALFVTEGNAPQGTDLTIFSGATVYTEVGPLAPRVSDVELFSNQAVFQYSDSEYYNNSPLSLANLNSAESWQDASLTSAPPASLEEQMATQLLSIDIPAGNSPSAGKYVVTLDQFPSTAAEQMHSAQLDVISIGFEDLSMGLVDVANLTGAGAAAPPRELARSKAASIATPAGAPTPTIPEPASVGLFGFVAAGMLARRRSNKA